MTSPETTYTHALTLQLGFIPVGFFPIGSVGHLTKLAGDHQKSGASQLEADLYRLNETPAFTKPEITAKAIADKARELVEGRHELTLSTKDLRADVKPLLAGAGIVLSSARGAFKDVAAGKTDVLKLATLLAAGQSTLEIFKGAGRKASEEITDAFWDIQTEDFIRNGHGIFVSKAWLENLENTTHEAKIRIKSPQPAPSAAP